jgi:MFS family permease
LNGFGKGAVGLKSSLFHHLGRFAKPMPPKSLTNAHLFVIVFAQFAGTSLWFAGNAILPDLEPLLRQTNGAIPTLNGWLTSAVQLGFISGTLIYALLALPDRFPTTRVFLVSVTLAALANVSWLAVPLRAETVLLSRFSTGFFLAGVYPVGMKISADWFRPVLGRAMGFLVGALVLGTAFPHLIRGIGATLPYRAVVLAMSALAVSGGILLFFTIPSKPVLPQTNRFRFGVLRDLFRPSAFRPAMWGYFGHLCEIYTLWAFLPMLISLYAKQHPDLNINVSVWAFFAIAAGFIGCVAGGYRALRVGSQRVGRGQLAASAVCILLAPLLYLGPGWLFGAFLLLWGAVAAGDSPQFTTLIANNAPLENRGSLLTLVTCIGFSITVISIQTMALFVSVVGPSVWQFWLMLPGVLLGLWASGRGGRSNP